MRRILLAAFLLLAGFAALAAPATAPDPARKPVRVLFVGNSLVALAEIPTRLQLLARHMGREVAVDSVTASDFSLEDHRRDGRAMARIAEGWDFVVLQQGPSSRPDNRKRLLEEARRFGEAARAAGAKPVLFAAWPDQDHPQDFPATIASYRGAAEQLDALLIPAAEAWLRVLAKDRRARLYSDGLHASAVGGDLALLTTWFTLFPAGPQEFDDAYLDKIAAHLRMARSTRDTLFDAATRAVDEPMVLK